MSDQTGTPELRRRLDQLRPLSPSQVRALWPMIEAAATLHYEIVAVHPFPDYNGRTARLAMNLALLRGGFPPISLLPGRERAAYFTALETSHVGEASDRQGDKSLPSPFITFVAGLVAVALDRYLRVLRNAEDDIAEPGA